MVQGTETSQHMLVYNGQKLEENKSLQDYNISDFSELELLQNGEPLYVILRMNCNELTEYCLVGIPPPKKGVLV